EGKCGRSRSGRTFSRGQVAEGEGPGSNRLWAAKRSTDRIREYLVQEIVIGSTLSVGPSNPLIHKTNDFGPAAQPVLSASIRNPLSSTEYGREPRPARFRSSPR